MAAVGDLNGDGHTDFAAGSFFADLPLQPNVGEVHVIFGGPTLSELGELNPENFDGSNGFTIIGKTPSDKLASVGWLGDVNDDGFDDLLVVAGTATEIGGVGEAYVFFGRPNVGQSGRLSPANLDGRNGFAINDIYGRGSEFFPSIGPGDLNGDGINDIVNYDPLTDTEEFGGDGITYVVFGGPGIGASGVVDPMDLDGTNGGIVTGSPGAQFVVEIIPDLNGDGIDELAFGDRNFDLSQENSGRVDVIFGHPDFFAGSNAIGLDQFRADPVGRGFSVVSRFENGRLGFAVGGAGDFNGDGRRDMIIGENGVDGDEGGVPGAYILFGDPSLGNEPVIETDALFAGEGGVAFRPADDTFGLGLFVARVFDVNGDGYDDVSVGAAGRTNSADRLHVVFGGPALNIHSPISMDSLDGNNGFTLTTEFDDKEELRSCYFAGNGGDFSSDGISDVLMACPDAGLNGKDRSGAVFVIFGKDVDGVADRDGDGVPDDEDNCLLVPNADQRDTNADGYGNLCDADLDNDCIVLAPDWFIMRDAFGSNADDPDLNGDDVVNGRDVRLLIGAIAGPPGPSGVTNVCSTP